MLYRGYFYNLKDERYQVEMITERNSGATRSLQLGVPPFVTEMEESDDNLYKPAKYQSATLKLVTTSATDYQFDAYATAPNSTIVRLVDPNANVKWCGFATPNLYNNGFTSENEELEIELIDALSILQYYKYQAQEKVIKSFADILIGYLFPKCELYTKVYVSEGVHISDAISAATPILNDLYISENNFFDDKNKDQTDDDVAWTMQEVLEQICQYLGYTCVADGDSIYLLDYDDLCYGERKFTEYNVGNTTPVQTGVSLFDRHIIEKEDYMGADNTISMTSCYNHILVKDSFRTYDSIVPSMYDNLENITASADTELSASTAVTQGMYGEVVPNAAEGNAEGDSNLNMICLVDKIKDPSSGNFTTPNAVFVKYFISPQYKTWQYSGETAESMSATSFNDNGLTLNYTDTKKLIGAVICKFDVERLEDDLSNVIVVDEHGHIIPGASVPLDVWLASNNISSVSFKNYIAMFHNEIPYIPTESASTFPFIQTTGSESASLFGGDNAYLIISGDYIWHYFRSDPYPIPSGEECDITEGRYYMLLEDCYILAKLKWGDRYWDGEEWVTGDTTFKLPYFDPYSKAEERRADATIFDALPIANTVSWRIGTTEKGYCIPVRRVMAGKPELTIYKPIDPNYRSIKTGSWEGQHYHHYVVFLKDFDIKAIIGDPTYSDINDSDTVYEAQISNGVMQSPTDFDDVEFKICTHDGKNPNYSSVAVKDGNGNYSYLDNHIYLTRWEYVGRMEQHYIDRFSHQYQHPNVKLTLQLDNNVLPYETFWCRWLTNVPYFVIDAQSIDYYNNQTTITLVQKR